MITKHMSYFGLVVVLVLSLYFLTTDVEARTIDFGGRSWYIKNGFQSPGPNSFSDSPQSVWVDADGLHLKIRKSKKNWYCAEVISVLPTKYGMHRFYTNCRLDQLDKNVVAAVFLYRDDQKEIDIELSRWGNGALLANNGYYAVQQPTPPSIHQAFIFGQEDSLSTHCINWLADRIDFRSIQGHFAEPPDESYLIKEWSYTGSYMPLETDSLKIQIVLWLLDINRDGKGDPPSDRQEVELIVSQVDYP